MLKDVLFFDSLQSSNNARQRISLAVYKDATISWETVELQRFVELSENVGKESQLLDENVDKQSQNTSVLVNKLGW